MNAAGICAVGAAGGAIASAIGSTTHRLLPSNAPTPITGHGMAGSARTATARIDTRLGPNTRVPPQMHGQRSGAKINGVSGKCRDRSGSPSGGRNIWTRLPCCLP